MAERSFDDFDEYAKDYRCIHTKNLKISGADSFYFAEMKVKLLKDFERNESLNFLDLGCGDGATEFFINQHYSSWKINAIDIAEKIIEEAKAKNITNTEFRVYDGKRIPYHDEAFDVIFMAGVLHHINFSLHKNLIEELYRVLKKEGRLYLFEHNPFNPFTKYLVNTCVFDKEAKLLKSNYTINLLKKNDFKICARRFIIFFPRKSILSKFIFLEKYLRWLPLGGQYFIVGKKPSPLERRGEV